MMTSRTSKEELESKTFPVKFDILNPSLIIPNKIAGIYKITSPLGRVYIGQSRNVQKRMNRYKNGLAKGQFRLHHSLLKYGLESHTFEILCICSIDELNDLECYYINLYDSFDTEHGLNLKIGGDVKVKVSDETKKKQSESHKGHVPWNKGKKYSPERIEQMRIISTGKKRTDEQKSKMRKPKPPRTAEHNKNNADARRGQKLSEESIKNINAWRQDEEKVKEVGKKISESKKGKKLSEEHKKSMSEATKGEKSHMYGKNLSPETKEKIRLANLGKKASPETKLKMSNARKGRKNSPESIKKTADANRGRKTSDETKQKQREAKLGKKKSPESIAKREATRKRMREEIEQEKRMMIF